MAGVERLLVLPDRALFAVPYAALWDGSRYLVERFESVVGVSATHALLAAGDHAVTVIRDSAGFVNQRVVATVVNIACDIAQQRIAVPDDIDKAVRLGLGYPKGPLAMGDAVGPQKLLKVLESMLAFYGDPRYRPSPWLKRRALLGVSLLTPEN